MEVSRALQQISEIHQVLSRSQVYRGYRPRTIAATALIAFVSAIAQVWWPSQDMVGLWACVAACSLALVAGEMAYDYIFSLDSSQKRLAFRLVEQFAPGIVLGGCLTILWSCCYPTLISLLPGLWSACYGLALFSARPLLARGVGWVALFYLTCAIGLLTPTGGQLRHLGMGATFGCGQALLAVTLYCNRPRRQ